jgi:DNA-binding transcriptional ArsR family regulator
MKHTKKHIIVRQGTTKEEIIKLISAGHNNLSVISEKLDLAPSTVSKHLHDLEANGIIKQKEDIHFKKWKYYRLDPKMNAEHIKKNGVTVSKTLIISGIAAALVISSLLYFIGAQHYNNGKLSISYVPISITDPPQVPEGTQALYLNYSSLTVHTTQGNSTQWLNLNSSGRLDLLSLVNKSQVIGLVGIEPNATVDQIRFNISSASIMIDNATYNVYIPTKEVLANVSGVKIVNDSSTILMDFEPTVTTIYTRNSTIFILVPSLRAAISPDAGLVTHSETGISIRLAAPLTRSMNQLFPNAIPNVTVDNSTISIEGGNVVFNATVSNSWSSNITIINMAIQNNTGPITAGGSITGTITNSDTIPIPETDMPASLVPGLAPINIFTNSNGVGFGNATSKFYKQSNNSTIEINASTMYAAWAYSGSNIINITLKNPVNIISISGFVTSQAGTAPPMAEFEYPYAIARGPGISFVVNNNGTLSPSSQFSIPQPIRFEPSQIGYILAPNSAVKFTYSGAFNAMGSGLLSNQSVYDLIVLTNMGPLTANVVVDK